MGAGRLLAECLLASLHELLEERVARDRDAGNARDARLLTLGQLSPVVSPGRLRGRVDLTVDDKSNLLALWNDDVIGSELELLAPPRTACRRKLDRQLAPTREQLLQFVAQPF